MLKALGINDEEVIVKALTDSNGDLELAMEALMSHLPMDDYGEEGGDGAYQ